ncbi:MAG: hypothetical protein AAGA48_22915 [Myxococcota bacterium]
MRPWFVVVGLATGCEFVPCPQGVPLTLSDVPCSCQGAVVESLDCGSLVCGEFGIEFETGDGSTEGCVGTSTYSPSSTTPIE